MKRILIGLVLLVTAIPIAVWSLSPREASPREAPAIRTVRVNGSTTVNPVVARAAEILRAERGLTITVDTQGGSSGGIAALGDGRAEMAMSSRPLNERDRRKYPRARFEAVAIGIDALALAVSRDVWEGGVRALSREQVRRVYEGEITNWRELGGPDRRIVFFNKEPGRGTWEVFAAWLYGSADDAPLVSLPEVGSNEEARQKIASTRGAITQLSLAWTDGETVYALAVRDGDHEIAPDPMRLGDGGYPLARPLYVITDGMPDPSTRALIELLLEPRGQELVRRAGYFPIAGAGDGLGP